MLRRPSVGLTTATCVFVALSGAAAVFLAMLVSNIVSDARDHPYGDGFGMLAAVAWIMMLGWIPLGALALWTVWKSRLSHAGGGSMRAITSVTGAPAPLIGWSGWTVVRVLTVLASLLLVFQLFADRSALPPEPVEIFRYVVFAAWTLTAIELLVRTHLAATGHAAVNG